MSTPADELSPVKRALLEIRALRERLADAEAREAARRAPIAIVGMGLRLPGGVHDADGFERLLWSGVDAVTGIPSERWSLDALYDADPDAPGKMTTRHGAFIDGVDRFDAEFFGIAPREAETMDPQQRLMLQVAWEALEDAGHAGADLAGSRTGVYVGVANNDYGRAIYARREQIDPYFATGNAHSVVAGRLSYVLGVQGPAIAVDTACSSSLVALHLAVQALRLGECERALVGGVNLILTPEMNINFSKARMMAPDGRCKTFDKRADGYVRGEGCAVLVLRRLDEALAAGDRVLAVIRGSALNQDGRSGGLTAPNGPAQQAVIRAALADAGVAGASIGYVEAHGTGTPLGDPIEVGALGAALCGGARDTPLVIGSVKTNLGHLEAAAGVAGVAKVVLALQRHEIPPHLHFEAGSPHIDWSLPLVVPTATQAWPPIDGRRLAGVSSFGFSGTNAHVVLEAAPEPAAPAPAAAARPLHLLALSARDPGALGELARAHAQRLSAAAGAGIDLADYAHTAHTGRAAFAERLAVSGANATELAQALSDFAEGRANDAVARGTLDGTARPRIAFLFTGQGAQHAGMGRALYDSAPVFRAAIDRCAEVLDPLLDPPRGRGLRELLFDADAPIDETRYAQPVNFAFAVALAGLWRSFGIEPVAVMGHSLGEYAAACVAGMLSLEDGLRLTAARGRLTHEHARDGAMAAVFAAEPVVRAVIAASGGQLSIAAHNGPAHQVISGPREAVAAAEARLAAAGVQVKPMRVPHAAHSAQIEPVLEPLRAVLDTVHFAEPGLELISNVTGAVAGLDTIGHTGYWLRHLREPVRFADSMRTLAARGITHCIEIGPHPVLLGMGAECVAGGIEWLPSLRRKRADWSDLLESLQRLHVAGAPIDWRGVDAGSPRRRVALPTYPFRTRRHWLDGIGAQGGAARAESPAIDAATRWSRLGLALDQQSEQGPLDLDAASYPATWDCLERLTLAHGMRTLRECGLYERAGESHDLDAVLARSGIGNTYRPLVQRWLTGLVARGHLRAEPAGFTSPQPLPEPQLDALWREAEERLAGNRPLLDYLRHCGSLLGAVLRGRESPLETLFPGGSDALARGLYERSATMRYVNALAAAAVASLVAAQPPGRTLRVLEVGAGTGGTTGALLPVLPPGRSRYVFSDVSELFLDRARARFATHDGIDFRRFDLDREIVEQGFDAASFDLIVSANAVHASTDLRAALRRLHALLAPGGVLLLVESTRHHAWFDMSTGLIEGWQHFADDLRGDDPLLAAPAWQDALAAAGFEASGAWPPAGSIAEALGQHVIAARVPGEPFDIAHSATRETVAGDAPADAAPAAAAETAETSLRAQLDAALPADRLDLLRDAVRVQVMRVLKLPSDEPPGRHDRLMDLGFDSLMAVQLRNRLGQALVLERPLAATLMFDHPTIDALALHLLERAAPQVPPPAAPPASVAAADAPREALGAATVAAMSDADIEALLLQRLSHP